MEKIKETNILVICSTLGVKKMAVQKRFGDIEVEISLGSHWWKMSVKGSGMVWMWI